MRVVYVKRNVSAPHSRALHPRTRSEAARAWRWPVPRVLRRFQPSSVLSWDAILLQAAMAAFQLPAITRAAVQAWRIPVWLFAPTGWLNLTQNFTAALLGCALSLHGVLHRRCWHLLCNATSMKRALLISLFKSFSLSYCSLGVAAYKATRRPALTVSVASATGALRAIAREVLTSGVLEPKDEVDTGTQVSGNRPGAARGLQFDGQGRRSDRADRSVDVRHGARRGPSQPSPGHRRSAAPEGRAR